MIHLFNRIYLKHESFFDTSSDLILARSVAKPHPLDKVYNLGEGAYPSFDEILERDFEGSIENFWSQLLQKEPDHKLMIYADVTVMNKLLFQYWKSIFKNPTVEALFSLYNFFILDSKLKSFLMRDDRIRNKQKFHSDLKYLKKEEFIFAYEQAEAIEALKAMDKSQVGFELLLANYFLPDNGKYKAAFEERLSALAWSSWFEDFQILRGEIFNAFYDIKRLFPELDLDFQSPLEVEDIISKIPQLAWIQDPKFEVQNMDYILRKYKKDTFIDLCQRFINFAKISETRSEVVVDVQDFAIHEMRLTEMVFAEKFKEYLDHDIRQGFGCSLVSNNLRHKANQMFACFIYDRIRHGEVEKLKPFELA